MSRAVTYVTQGPWAVSHTSSGGVTTLHVSRPGIGRKRIKGTHDGRTFANSDDSRAFAFERGYLVEHAQAGAAWRSAHRRRTAYWGLIVYFRVKEAATHAALIQIGRELKAWANGLGCEPLNDGRYSGAPFVIARRIRPDLMA